MRKNFRAAKADRTDPRTGIVFDSLSELRRWNELLLLQRAGEISELRRQVAFPLYAYKLNVRCVPEIVRIPILLRSDRYPNGRHCKWTADFAYRENGEDVFEDYKGLRRDIDRLRIAIFEACYGVRVRITGPNAKRKRRLAAERAA